MESRNWGRWGEADERGALNLLSNDVVKSAAGLVRTGQVFSLAYPIAQHGQPAMHGRTPPLHFMTLDGADFAAGVRMPGGLQMADDVIMITQHGTVTHVDALGHCWYDDRMYNNHDPKRVRSYGATRCGIENVESIVTRGVLLDVAGLKNLSHLPGGYAVTDEDLADCCDKQGVKVGQADAVLIRTGWMSVFYQDEHEFNASQPGPGVAAAHWLLDRDISLMGVDNLSGEVVIAEGVFDGRSSAPLVHRLLLRDNGIYIMELLDLDKLAQARAYEFLFVTAPLKIQGGVGSPVNPLAII